ncbi:MAG: hypothetical protein H0V35_08030 [Nitrospira sp.]|nr:hypothetical protein [Nitrospira sp.]
MVDLKLLKSTRGLIDVLDIAGQNPIDPNTDTPISRGGRCARFEQQLDLVPPTGWPDCGAGCVDIRRKPAREATRVSAPPGDRRVTVGGLVGPEDFPRGVKDRLAVPNQEAVINAWPTHEPHLVCVVTHTHEIRIRTPPGAYINLFRIGQI